jgi:LysM repeat protein
MSEERNHINSEALKKYLSGSLNEAEQKQFEDAMDADSFEKEAFEGFNSIEDKAVLLTAVRSIEKSVADKTGLKQGRGFVFPGWKIMSIAAGLALLLIGVFLMKKDTSVVSVDIAEESSYVPAKTDTQIVSSIDSNSTSDIELDEEIVLANYQADSSADKGVESLEDEADDFEEKEKASNTVVPKYFIYKVKNGDTLGHIAVKYDVDVSQIKKWNSLMNDKLQIGQKLMIYIVSSNDN